MKNSLLPWAKKEQTSNMIDLQKLFNDYWTSKAREITVKGQSWSSTSPQISHRKIKRSLILERVNALWSYDSL